MPTHKSCEKRIRQNTRANARNVSMKSRIRTAIRNVLDAKDKEKARQLLSVASSIIDKAAKTGVIHQNKAGNNKSRLFKHVASLA